jgi:hypothetical protein
MLLFNLSASGFLLVVYHGKLSMKLLASVVPLLFVVTLFFGIMGTIRSAHKAGTAYTNAGFLETGSATEGFRNSGVPAEFFWAYIYTSSPLANLATNLSSPTPPLTSPAFGHWVINEILPDFISKRVNHYTGGAPKIPRRIPGPFNASTVYAGSYSYFGWPGLFLMAAVILSLPFLLLRILPISSPFFLTGFVLMNTMFLFMIFENMIKFSGLSFQLVYPVILTIGIRKFAWIKNIFSLQ